MMKQIAAQQGLKIIGICIALCLIASGCSPLDMLREVSGTQSTTSDGFTPLNLAVREGDVDTVKTLLNEGADPNKEANYGSGEEILVGNLSLAVNFNEEPTEIVKLLLEAGADPAKDFMAMSDAIDKGNLDVVELMVEYGGDINGGLQAAVMSNQIEIATMLLQHGADPNQGVTLAKTSYNADMLQLLAEAGAVIDTLPREQTNPEDYVKEDGSLIRLH